VGGGEVLINWFLTLVNAFRPRVCAVSYLNTLPLVWGMLHGPQRGLFDLEFRIPSECADRMASGAADIGIVPSFELTRQDLAIVKGAGIGAHGAVRSILLICKRPPAEIRTLAADSSSRTSVQLARVILERRFGATPKIAPHAPDLEAMLRGADAALLIGDPALKVDRGGEKRLVYDLAEEWQALTGLPMVFAVWAGRREMVTPELTAAFRESMLYGRERIGEIVEAEAARRGFAAEVVRDYLEHRIVHELGPRDYDGMDLFLRYAGETAVDEASRTRAV